MSEIGRGAGARLHHDALQVGDPRCNRTAYGCSAGEGYPPLFDEDGERDRRCLDDFVAAFGGMDFAVAPALLAARLASGRRPLPCPPRPRRVGAAVRRARRGPARSSPIRPAP